MAKKRILLMAGAGTLGGYATIDLLENGWTVDVICLNDFTSYNKNLRYIKANVTDELLRGLFAENRYDCIIDFMCYGDKDMYPARGSLLLENTDQLIFLSSYRVYADEEHPVRETSPQLLDVLDDQEFLNRERYAIPKSHCEKWLRSCGKNNWTIVRPVISFSHYRLDLVCTGAYQLLRACKGKKILLPQGARNLHAGLSWAADSGRLIARLAGNSKAMGEDFTIASGENYHWSEIADMYTRAMGAEFIWVPVADYHAVSAPDAAALFYDRMFDRNIDNSKLLAATGLTKADMYGIPAGINRELDCLAKNPDLVARFETPHTLAVDAKIDAYIAERGLA